MRQTWLRIGLAKEKLLAWSHNDEGPRPRRSAAHAGSGPHAQTLEGFGIFSVANFLHAPYLAFDRSIGLINQATKQMSIFTK